MLTDLQACLALTTISSLCSSTVLSLNFCLFCLPPRPTFCPLLLTVVCLQADQVPACFGDSAHHRASEGGHHILASAATAKAASHSACQDVERHQGVLQNAHSYAGLRNSVWLVKWLAMWRPSVAHIYEHCNGNCKSCTSPAHLCMCLFRLGVQLRCAICSDKHWWCFKFVWYLHS